MEVRQILEQKWSILTDCLMIKNAYKKQERSNLTLACYFGLMATTLLLLEVSTFTVLRASGQAELGRDGWWA